MTAETRKTRQPAETRKKLIAAARVLILERGYTGAGVDQICEAAGVTKGAFFHHFKSKDEIGKAALADWAEFGMGIYATAKAEPRRYPLDHVHKFIDLMIGMMTNPPAPVTCVVGIMSQELALANPVLREACAGYLGDWADFARELLEEAKAAHPPKTPFDADELAWFLESLWQGSMLISKTRGEPHIARRNLERAKTQINELFGDDSAIKPAGPALASETSLL